jgi:hypothetical protein
MPRGSPTITVPFTVVRDQREQAPYQFAGLRADSKQQHKPLIVSVESVHLLTGDYSIKGFETEICVERKSKEDLYSTLRDQEHRDRFKAEHERMTGYAFAVVVIEASWESIMNSPPKDCQLRPISVWRTFQKWRLRYGVNWEAIGPRAMAEEHTFRTLQFYHEEFINVHQA